MRRIGFDQRTDKSSRASGSPGLRRAKEAAIQRAEILPELSCPKCGKKPNGVRKDGKFAVYVHKRQVGGNLECRAEIWQPPRIKVNVPGYR